MVSWVRKYRPQTVKEVVGQDSAVKQLRDFVVNFSKQKKKSMLLYGQTGVGKTCAVYAIANEIGYEVIEVNASDARNKEQVSAVLGNAVEQQSLLFKGKVVLVDEIDGLSGTKDRGGIQALAKLIAKPAFPIVLTANNPWDSKFSSIRSKSVIVQFHALNYLSVTSVLKAICKSEKMKCDETLLKTLARRASGDLRAAVNDLQSLAEKSREITQTDLDELSQRNQMESIIQALTIIFKTTHAELAVSALDNIEENLDIALLWIDENLPKEYVKPEDLARAYDSLAAADVFRGRIRRWQYWRFLVYQNALMTAGVAVAKDEKYKNFVKYMPTRRILKMWQANMRYQKRKAIAARVAEATHSSAKEVLKSTMPYMRVIFRKDKAMREEIAEALELDKEQVDWLKK